MGFLWRRARIQHAQQEAVSRTISEKTTIGKTIIEPLTVTNSMSCLALRSFHVFRFCIELVFDAIGKIRSSNDVMVGFTELVGQILSLV